MIAYKYIVDSIEGPSIYEEFDTAAEAIAYAKEHVSVAAYVDQVEVELNDFGEVVNVGEKERIYPESGMTPEEEEEWVKEMEKRHEDELLVDPYEADEFGDCYTNVRKSNESFDADKIVEELEEHEDEVECKKCYDLFPKADCIKTAHGYICKECAKQHESLESTLEQDLNDDRTPHQEEPIEMEEPFVANDMRKHEHAIKEGVEQPSEQQVDNIVNSVLDSGLNESILDEDFKSIFKKILKAALMGLAGAGVTLVTANPALGAAASLGVGALTDVAKEVTGEVFDWVEAKRAGNKEKAAEIEDDIEDTAGENNGGTVIDRIKQAWNTVVGNPDAGKSEQIPLFAYESLNEDKALNEDWLAEYWWEDDDPMNWDDKFGPLYLIYCNDRPVGYIEWPYEGREYTPSEERVFAAARRLFNLANDAVIDYEPVDSDSVDIDLPFHDRTEITEHIQDRPAPIETEQELHGMDNAVVDCQTDMKVIAHSEDEKPLDCKMKKAPLEKPLTEDTEKLVSNPGDLPVDKKDEVLRKTAQALRDAGVDTVAAGITRERGGIAYETDKVAGIKKAIFDESLKEGVSLDNPLLKKGIGYLNRNPNFFGYVCSYRNGKTHQKVLVDKGFRTEAELKDFVNKQILSNRDVVDVEVLRQGDQEKYLAVLRESNDPEMAEIEANMANWKEPSVSKPQVQNSNIEEAEEHESNLSAVLDKALQRFNKHKELGVKGPVNVLVNANRGEATVAKIKEHLKDLNVLFLDFAADPANSEKSLNTLLDSDTAYNAICIIDINRVPRNLLRSILQVAYSGKYMVIIVNYIQEDDNNLDQAIVNKFTYQVDATKPLDEAKKVEDELPPDPSAVKVEVHTMLNDLVADEIEAINGYEEAKQEIMDAPIEHKDDLLDTVDHITDEEKEHIDELIDAASEIPFDKESAMEDEDPFNQDFDDAEEVKEAEAADEVEAPVDESYAGIPFDSEVKEGDKIRIIHLAGENSDYDGKEGVVEHIDGIGQLHGTWGGLAVIPGVDEFEVIVDESLNEDLTPLEKMKAVEAGTRKENWKACSTVKLAKYRDICEQNGLTNALAQIDAEFTSRKSGMGWDERVEMADKLLDELIKHTHNMDYDDGDGYWLSEYDIWCNRYLYHKAKLHNTADIDLIGSQLAKLVDGLDFYWTENEFEPDEDDEDYEDELISEIGYTLEK